MPDFHRIHLGTLPLSIPDAFALHFDGSMNDAGEFDRHGISFPTSIERSVERRRAEYLAGRRVALAALREQGAEVSDIPIGPQRAPIWPRGFTGSITHADRLAAAVATPATSVRGVGIDIEHVPDDSALQVIRDSVIDAAEGVRLEPLAQAIGWPLALTVAFSAKESFYKATSASIGRFLDFSGLRMVGFESDDLIVAEVTETVAPSLRAGTRFVLSYRLLGRYSVMTACVW